MFIGTLGIHFDNLRNVFAQQPNMIASRVHSDVSRLKLEFHNFIVFKPSQSFRTFSYE